MIVIFIVILIIIIIVYLTILVQFKRKISIRRSIFISNFHCLLELCAPTYVYMSFLGLKVLVSANRKCFRQTITQTGYKVNQFITYYYWSKKRNKEEFVYIVIDANLKGMIYDSQPVEQKIENINDLYLLNVKEG